MLIAHRNGMMVRKEDLTKYPGTVFIVTMGDNETFSFPIGCASLTTVNWGDGAKTDYTGGPTISHTYALAGTYTIKITDTVSRYGQINDIAKNFPLQIVKFGDSPAIIYGYAFRWYYGLTSVGNFAGVTDMSYSVYSSSFLECTSLTSIGAAPNLTSIPSSSFSGCSALNKIGKYVAVTSLGSYCFTGTSALSIEVENDIFPSVTSMGTSAFRESGITSAYFPSLTTISNPSGIEGSNTFRGSTHLKIFRAPLLTVLPQRMVWNCTSLETCKVGLVDTIGNGTYSDIFYGTPSSMRVWVKNTMASLMSFTGLPWNANNGAIFYCADGYVSRINGTWTGTAYSSVSDLPSVGDEAYEFQVGGTTYIWNGTAYEVKSV